MTTFVFPCGNFPHGNTKNSNGPSPCLGHANYIPFGCFISLVQNYTYASKKRPGIKTQIPMSH